MAIGILIGRFVPSLSSQKNALILPVCREAHYI